MVHGSGGVSENDELGEDLLSILHVFLCRQYGRRKYGNKRGASKETTEKGREYFSKRRRHSGEKGSDLCGYHCADVAVSLDCY